MPAPTADPSRRRAPGPQDLCLWYLMAGGAEDARARVRAQYARGENMTDALAALRLLVDDGGVAGDEALAGFYDRWSADPLVLDKWFSIQATSARPETLLRVAALLVHPAYDSRNPNRVRSLVGAFCAGNPVRFHAPDGAGYRFLADQVLDSTRRTPRSPRGSSSPSPAGGATIKPAKG